MKAQGDGNPQYVTMLNSLLADHTREIVRMVEDAEHPMLPMYVQIPAKVDATPLRLEISSVAPVPKPSATPRRAKRRPGNKNPIVGSYLGVRNTDCSREQCQVTSRKTGECYEICHSRLTEVLADGHVRVQYIDHERDDDVLPWAAIQKTLDKDMRWCEHGRICNHIVRSGRCDKQHDEMSGMRPFCHNSACLNTDGNGQFA